jgi:hypothetical protein
MKKMLSVTFLLVSCIIVVSSKASAQTKKLGTRGDTLVFQASAYVIQPNDKADDLLKRLPGITIDTKGKMYSQEDTVDRLLVDGNEFFSEDPTAAARMLRADKVDKIKVYWRWSDQASFTGIEDNVKFKTINIILKKETR